MNISTELRHSINRTGTGYGNAGVTTMALPVAGKLRNQDTLPVSVYQYVARSVAYHSRGAL